MKKLILILIAVLFTVPAWAGPVSRNIDSMPDGKYRAYSAPINYKTPSGKFAKIDVDATTSTLTTLSRDKAPVKSEFKDRQIKFTPDEGKWSLTVRAGTMILTGGSPSLALTAKPEKDPQKPDQTIMDGGKFRCDTTALGTKFLIPSTDKITDFSCPFILTPSKDMKIIQKGQTVWCEVDGKVVLTLAEPKLLDADLKVIGYTLTAPLDLVDFTLVDNKDKDGTWTYTKTPGPDFAKAKLPENYYIDVNVALVVGSSNIRFWGTETIRTFTDVRAELSGNGGPYTYGIADVHISFSKYRIYRMQLIFDLTGIEGTITSGILNYYVSSQLNPPSTQILEKSTATLPLAKIDYSSMVGGIGGSSCSDYFTVSSTGWKTATVTDLTFLNAAVGDSLAMCMVRDMDHTGVVTKQSNIRDDVNLGSWYMELTIAAPTPAATRNPWKGFRSWTDDGFLTW